MNITVPISVDAVVHSVVRITKIAMGRLAQRLYKERGVMKTETKDPQAPAI